MKITKAEAIGILYSKGNPSLKADMAGEREATELRDGDKKQYGGCRGERIEKFNPFMYTEHQLKRNFLFAGKNICKNVQ
jgi:enolase